jgi:membrane protease YdiL (CAAX protease family)
VIIKDKKNVSIQFTLVTFCIVFISAGALIVLGQFGFAVQTASDAWMNIPFVIYICSPMIASYIVLKRNGKVTGLKEWLKNIFILKCKISHYIFAILGIVIFFSIQIIASGGIEEGGLYILANIKITNPLFIFFLSLPVTLVMGGMEEAGWMYILHPELNKKYGFILSSIFVGLVWIVWHIPLFFIPGTLHYAGVVSFWMFGFSNIFGRFFYGALHKISGSIFLCILFHAMTNAGYNAFIFQRTWFGYITGFTVLFIFSAVLLIAHNKRKI